jgi:hypothetical protein
VEVLRGAGDVLQAQQGAQHRQQIEVDIAEGDGRGPLL